MYEEDNFCSVRWNCWRVAESLKSSISFRFELARTKKRVGWSRFCVCGVCVLGDCCSGLSRNGTTDTQTAFRPCERAGASSGSFVSDIGKSRVCTSKGFWLRESSRIHQPYYRDHRSKARYSTTHALPKPTK